MAKVNANNFHWTTCYLLDISKGTQRRGEEGQGDVK